MEIIYKAFDGTKFHDKRECLRYEKDQQVNSICNEVKAYKDGIRITDFTDIEDILNMANAIHFDSKSALESWHAIADTYEYVAPDPKFCDYSKPLNFYYDEESDRFIQYSDTIKRLEDEINTLREEEKLMEEGKCL